MKNWDFSIVPSIEIQTEAASVLAVPDINAAAAKPAMIRDFKLGVLMVNGLRNNAAGRVSKDQPRRAPECR